MTWETSHLLIIFRGQSSNFPMTYLQFPYLPPSGYKGLLKLKIRRKFSRNLVIWLAFMAIGDKGNRDVKFYHLLKTVAHKQLTTEDCSLSPWTHKYSQYSRWWNDFTQLITKKEKSVCDFSIWKTKRRNTKWLKYLIKSYLL